MNVCDLTGPELDVWVARALEAGEPSGVDKYGAPIVNGKRSLAFLIEKYRDFPQVWSPSTNWTDAAPILMHLYGEDFLAESMRRFVLYELGDTVCKK